MFLLTARMNEKIRKVEELSEETATSIADVSKPYISAITKRPCVTVSAPLRSEEDLIVGGMGIDLRGE